MDVPAVQHLLAWVSTVIALVSFTISAVWQFWYSSPDRDWAEKLGRAAFHALQCLVWGGLVAVIVLYNYGVPFGGSQ